MKELKFREEAKEKYVEDILDTDLVGVESSRDGSRYLVVKYKNNFIAVSKDDNGNYSSKIEESSKSKYVQQFCPKPKRVLLFDNEAEMLVWYNNK